MKRTVSLLLAVAMLLAFIPASVSAAEGEAFTIDYGTYKKETSYTEDNARFYLITGTKGENWEFDPANTTNKAYYDNKTSGCRLQSQITIAKRDRDDGVAGPASVAFRFKAPASGTYNVTTDVYARTVCGYVDVHIIDGAKKIYLGRMDNYNSSNKDVTKKLLSVTLEKDKEYSIAYTPVGNSSGTAASLYVYRTKFTPTDSPVFFENIKVSADKTSLTKDETAKLTTKADISNGALFSFDTIGGTLSYKSSAENVATVSQDGTVTAIGEGEATITATLATADKSYTSTVKISVTQPKIKTVSVSAPKYILTSDSEGKVLSVSAKMDDGKDVPMASAQVSFQSLDTAVANVTAGGVVTPVSVGDAKIKVTVTYEGFSAEETCEIMICDVVPPDGRAFSVDFLNVDRSTQVFPSNTSSDQSFSNKNTRGDIWTIDTKNTFSTHYDGTSKSMRIQSSYAYITSRGPFAINFEVAESGNYNVAVTAWEYTSTGDVHFYIDGVYSGSVATKGTVLQAMEEKNLLGATLSQGTHSLIIVPDGNNAFVRKLDFTPVYEHSSISKVSATVGNTMMYVGTEQDISVGYIPTVEMWYESGLGKTKFDGSAGIIGAVSYSGYDSEILSVSADGRISALSAGRTEITVSAEVGGKTISDTFEIEVRIPVIETVSIEAPRYILIADEDGEVLPVSAKMTNGADVDMSKATVTFESLLPKIADVSAEGVVTPKKEGMAEIKVTVTYEGVSVESTVEIPITKESLPDGTKFILDFGTVDTSTTYTEDGTRFYAKAETRGENWALDTTNTTSKTYYDNKTNGIRVAQPGITANNRTGDKSGNAGFAIKFTAPETGLYDVNAAISLGPTCAYVDMYLIDGAVKTYIGSYDSWDASSSYPKSDVDLLSVNLEGGKEYSLLICQSPSQSASDRVYMTSISFTPVKVASEVIGVSASVDDNNIAAGESVDLIAAAETSNGVIYEIEKSKKNPDGGLSIVYRSSDDNVAAVSEDGIIRGIAAGEAYITAEIELPGGKASKEVRITVNANTYESAGINIEEGSVYVVGGSQMLVPAAILSDGSGASLRDITARFESDNEAVAKISEGKLIAVSEGSASITAHVTFNGKEKSVTRKINVENVRLSAIEAEAERISALDAGGSQIKVTGILNNGEKINLADAAFDFESLTPEIVDVDENGVAYYVTRGIGSVRVSAEIGGESFECECNIVSSSAKRGPTIYTNEMRAQALVNASKYDWAKKLVKTAKTNADKFVEHLDTVYSLIPVEGVPRASGNATWNAGANYEYICPYCRTNLQEKYGGKPWKINPLRNPWKIQCPECKRLFPSNDFESFYKLGITEDGVFDRELAMQKNNELIANGEKGYLVNILYPDVWKDENLNVSKEAAETWMVDDGFGWSDVDGTYGTQTLPKFTPVAHYAHLFWDSNGPDDSFFTNGLMALRDAYLYTGEAKYGRAGVILLDRVADVYPDFDLAKYSLAYPNSHGLGYNGKVLGSIWETRFLQELNSSYDAFYPMTDDAQVINYLSEKAEKLGLENKKTNPDLIRENMENGILRETYEATKKSQSNGNFGMHQLALAYAAVALDNQPETDEMFDWIGRLSTVTRGPIVDPVYGGTWGGFKSANSGGDVLLKYVRDVDRDGFGNEVGSGYNALWITNGIEIADVINRYDPDTELNLFENPKYVKMYSSFIRETLGNGYTIHLGDAGRVGGPGIANYGAQALRAFNATKDPLLAQVYYFYQRGKLDDVYIDIFTDNDSLKSEIQAVIDTYGEYKFESEYMTGFGLAVLRGGKNIPQGASAGVEQRYDTWMYAGITGGHGHYDSLALGVDAYGFNFMPDLGYPENTGYNPNRLQWVMATISHNTVVVDNDTQSVTSGSKPLHFDDAGKVKLVDANSPSAYLGTDIYRRTAVTVEASSEVAYTLDFFRVKGGNSHTYSFHTQSYMGYSTDDLDLVPQVDEEGNYVGTYAGADVPYGDDPNTDLNGSGYKTKYTRGYTWLENVNRATPESGTFSVNFEQTDFNNQVNDSKGLNLKFMALNDWEPSGVGIMTGYAPRTSSNKNVPGLDYMLIHREGENLDTLFTSLLQPYKGEEYIKSASALNAELIDGRTTKDDAVKAVRVELINGRVDYIVYSTNSDATYNITDGDISFNFRGFVGVYSVNAEGENIYSYINDGDIIGDAETAKEYTGKVVDFTRELCDENSIIVSFDADVSLDEIKGRYIYIDNSGSSNGVYRIKDAKNGEQGNIILELGDVSLINGFISTSNLDAGYTYNISPKQTFRIPLSAVADDAPVFADFDEEASTTAGSAITINLGAESPIGADVKYELSVAPRGATIDEESGEITWKPDASQLGESGFVITARDSDGRESNAMLTVAVYGSTGTPGGGGSTGAPTTPSTPTIPATKPEDKDNSTSSTDNGNKTPSVGDADSSLGEGAENVRFIDLGNHAWAADAINALADEGIIKGTSENTFSPAANITRADFAILLVRAFKLASESEENFADVSASDYFAKELAVARNTGLVNGIGENKFAPRNNITRQDMMVIVYRALVAMEKEFDTTAISAPDFANVADYAKDAVAALVNAKLISGKNGLIDPTANTTRAEVAVLIQRILDYIR